MHNTVKSLKIWISWCKTTTAWVIGLGPRFSCTWPQCARPRGLLHYLYSTVLQCDLPRPSDHTVGRPRAEILTRDGRSRSPQLVICIVWLTYILLTFSGLIASVLTFLSVLALEWPSNKFISVYRSLCYFLKEAMHIYDKTLVAVKKENEILGVRTS